MPETMPFTLSRRLSQLIGRKVTFAPTAATPDTKAKQIFAIYTVLPIGSAIIVKADLRLLGSLAGALVGWPDPIVKEHLEVTPMEELLRDAIYEVFNVSAAAIGSENRAVFTKMVTNPIYIDGDAGTVLKSPGHRNYFNVSVDGYVGGRLIILSPFAPK